MEGLHEVGLFTRREFVVYERFCNGDHRVRYSGWREWRVLEFRWYYVKDNVQGLYGGTHSTRQWVWPRYPSCDRADASFMQLNGKPYETGADSLVKYQLVSNESMNWANLTI